jgi:hypothetical protein
MTGPGPNLGTGSVMVYDVMRQCVVLWGNAAGSGNAQLWEWNGATWQQRLVAMPTFPGSVGYAYDRARGVTVVFGGTTTNDDTWEWNGVAWSHPLPAVRPPAREQSAMAFDPITQRCLLYGGFGTNQVKLVDTWTWNGSIWQQQFPASPPFSRDQATMVVDVDRARVVLQGGSDYDFQTWEWDGAQWHYSNPNAPGAWLWRAGFYDTVRRETVLHGGMHPWVGNTNYTWRYRTPNGAAATSFGAGCAGSAGTPLLAKAPYTLPWLGDTMRTRVNTVPTSLGALFVSSFTPATPTSLTPFGMPGCNLLVTPDALEFRSANAGAAEWTLAIPNNTALVGMPIHQQALPLDPTANALGVVASNGLVMVPGIR